ncbi:MAG: hypothetical protein LDL41_25150 [Coleofasciculus sp. S288]|nr:hypothetical protein [Coleofasciculus sp. S288]
MKYIILFLLAVIIASIYWNNLLFNLLKQGFPFLFSTAIFSLIVHELWSNRSKLNFIFKIYFKSGILTYLRAFGIALLTLTIGIVFYIYAPEFMRWGWGNLVFGNSANVMFQPLDTANQVGQHVSELQGNHFDFRWLFLIPVWMLFILALPFWAEVEEKLFRQGIHSWKEITISSIKFGLVHLVMGIPICWALTLSIPGFLFACRYKYAYHRHLKKFKDEAKAQTDGVLASTADHTLYNAILITFSVVLLLLIS